MEAFDHLFTAHFADSERSLTNTLGGFVDHASRLAAGLPATGPLVALLAAANADTQSLSTQAQAVQQTLGLSLGTQKQGTSQTATAQTTALDRIRKNEGTLKGDALIEDEQERQRLYALLYPSGLKYYTAAPVGTALADRLDEYLTRTEAEKDALGVAFVQRTQAALGPFRNTRETQVGSFTTTDTARDDRHELSDRLDAQCDYNYHLLSAHFRQELDRPASFWNPTYYQRAAPRTPHGHLPAGFAIQPHQHRELFDLTAFAGATGLSLTLPAGGPFFLARVATATAPRPAAFLEVQPQAGPRALLLSQVPGTGPHLLGYNEGDTAVKLAAEIA